MRLKTRLWRAKDTVKKMAKRSKRQFSGIFLIPLQQTAQY
jgi:hypothetical protein